MSQTCKKTAPDGVEKWAKMQISEPNRKENFSRGHQEVIKNAHFWAKPERKLLQMVSESEQKETIFSQTWMKTAPEGFKKLLRMILSAPNLKGNLHQRVTKSYKKWSFFKPQGKLVQRFIFDWNLKDRGSKNCAEKHVAMFRSIKYFVSAIAQLVSTPTSQSRGLGFKSQRCNFFESERLPKPPILEHHKL